MIELPTKNLIYAGELNYESPQHKQGNLLCKCDWRLYKPAAGQYVSLVIERKDNPGSSVTNAAEVVADRVLMWILRSRPLEEGGITVRHFEAYLDYFREADARVDEVVFRRTCWRGPVGSQMVDHHFPGWKPMPLVEFLELISG